MRTRLLLMLFLLGGVQASFGAEDMPADIAQMYARKPEALVSDEFDAPDLDTSKWGYRTAPLSGNWLQSNVSIESDGVDHYLDLRGECKRTADADGIVTGTGSSSGIYSKNTMGHGFYSTRWRVEGIRPDKKSSWHPAIWCHRSAPGTRLPRDHIELDLIEFAQSRTLNVQWHSQGVEWVWDEQIKKYRMTTIECSRYSSDFEEGVWSTHGLEYHPDYIQLWEYNEDAHRWSRRGKQIRITSSSTDKKSMNINEKSAHKQAYWILSNYDFFDRVNKMWEPYHGRPVKSTDNFLMGDSALQIDYFRFRSLASDDADD